MAGSELIVLQPTSRRDGAARYGFRHALAREAAYGLLTDSDLATGHRLAAEYLEASGERDAAIIGEHFARGGERPRAVACYLRAAESRLEQGDLRGALRCVDLGIACRSSDALLGHLCSIQSLGA